MMIGGLPVFSRLQAQLSRLIRPGHRLEVWLEAKYIDEKGRLRVKRRPAQSFVKGFIGLLRAQIWPDVSTPDTIVNTAGDTGHLDDDQDNFGVKRGTSYGIAGDDDTGIVVGTDPTSPSIDDYNLKAKISHGTGAGQLEYGDMALAADYAVVGNKARFILSRTFTNSSGGDIGVEEVGLICAAQGIFGGYAGTYRILVDRSLLSFTILNGVSATVSYEIGVTV